MSVRGRSIADVEPTKCTSGRSPIAGRKRRAPARWRSTRRRRPPCFVRGRNGGRSTLWGFSRRMPPTSALPSREPLVQTVSLRLHWLAVIKAPALSSMTMRPGERRLVPRSCGSIVPLRSTVVAVLRRAGASECPLARISFALWCRLESSQRGIQPDLQTSCVFVQTPILYPAACGPKGLAAVVGFFY